MRLVRTQARLTRNYLKQAEKLVTDAIKARNYQGLRNKLIMLLGPVPAEALKLIDELALYESRFTQRVIKKHLKKDLVTISDGEVLQNVHQRGVRVALKTPSQTIQATYNSFIGVKVGQYMQVLSDGNITREEPDVLVSKVSNLTNGLFTRQNLVLAGIAVIGAANLTRELVALKNDLRVQWMAELDETTCPYCEDMDGEIFEEETDDIPAHANCRCTWSIVE